MLGIIITGTGVLMGFAATAILFFFRKGHDWGFPISFIFTLVISIVFAVKLNDKREKEEKEKYTLYELKLSDNTIIRDSLCNEKEYFYDKKGTEYYKTNIIYSKKINTK